jgi:hypothetical protein
MATPAVAGEAALVLARAPHLGAIGLKQVLMASAVAKPAFQGASVTGARADAARAAASVAAPLSPPADADGDGAADAGDNCPAAANRGQGDADGDGTGDACDATPHPPAPAADRDADGRPDAADTCPAERAATRTGCPVPTVRRLSLALGAGRRSATVRVRPDRAARATITIEHRRCARRRCHWARLLRRNIALPSRGASLRLEAPRGRRLPHGSYRVRAVLSSAAGTARPVVRAFRL